MEQNQHPRPAEQKIDFGAIGLFPIIIPVRSFWRLKLVLLVIRDL